VLKSAWFSGVRLIGALKVNNYQPEKAVAWHNENSVRDFCYGDLKIYVARVSCRLVYLFETHGANLGVQFQAPNLAWN
jgi:hypothetical protein